MFLFGISVLVLAGGTAAARAALALTQTSSASETAPPVMYELDLRQPQSHLVQVSITVANARAGTELQFPTWYALYQIRDFIKDVQQLRAECDGRPIELKVVDLNTRESPGRCAQLELHYAVYSNGEPPFSSVLDGDHGFFNPAMLLFYLPEERGRGVRLRFMLPPGWKLATLLEDGPGAGEYQAANYDALADSPAEAGTFQEYDYVQSGATYRVIVDAKPSDYSADHLVKSLEKITSTETALMGDVPFSRYTFIFHFSSRGGGGMEHANGTAIVVSAGRRGDLHALESISAHEFFHLWNVKRIRPQGLEPIDYIHGNDTGDLWFSEGVTSTYAELALLRAGLTTREDFYSHLAEAIAGLERRPARRFQSVEQSGREVWLEKYSDYFRPERSISYYNKGELLGYLLDLGMRHATADRHGLDDVMRGLDRDFAHRGRFFTDADLVGTIGSLAPDFAGLDAFFREYVDGTADLDFDTYLAYAGLGRSTEEVVRPAPGFEVARRFEAPLEVQSVDRGSNAERAGLRRGDFLVEMNDRPLSGRLSGQLGRMKPGQKVKFRVRRESEFLDLEFELGGRTDTVTHLVEMSNPTAEQLAVREGWLEGKTRR